MPQNHTQIRDKLPEKQANLSNVKKLPKYERFGEHVRYFTIDEFRLFTDAIDSQEYPEYAPDDDPISTGKHVCFGLHVVKLLCRFFLANPKNTISMAVSLYLQAKVVPTKLPR